METTILNASKELLNNYFLEVVVSPHDQLLCHHCIVNIVIIIMIIHMEFTILNASKESFNNLLAELLQPVVNGERIPETGTLVVSLAVDNSLFRF